MMLHQVVPTFAVTISPRKSNDINVIEKVFFNIVFSKDFEVVITDLTGKVMMKTTSNTVDISTFATGTYLYQLKSGNKVGSGKLIKK
jgi:hypothetical protein